MDRLRRYLLYFTVCVTGASVLVVEVAAVRLLSPYFGSSLYVLSSVLTVILGALSLGYYLGGRYADRYPSHEPLYGIIAISGITVLLTEFLASHLLPVGTILFSILSGSLVFSMGLFFLPAFLLGLVSPYVVRLLSSDTPREHMGNVVGVTFFAGTFGSIVGSLLTGFLFIPAFGVQNTLVSVGIILVFLGLQGGAILSMFGKDERVSVFVVLKRRQMYYLSILVITTLLYVLSGTESVRPDMKVVYESDGLYSHILVYEDHSRGHTLRALKRDANNSSATYLDSYDLVFGYTQFAELYSSLLFGTKEFLLIGGGAYSIPRTLTARDQELHVDVVEIEPELFELSKEFFDLSDTSRIKNHIVDGRVYLQKSSKKYDVIYGDAFGTDMSIPAHLATKEFFEEVRADLADDGIFMLNHIGTLTGSEPPTLTGSLFVTLKSVFPNVEVYAFNTSHPTSRQNIMYIARNGHAPIDLTGNAITSTGGLELSVPDMEWKTDRFNEAEELLLTDDRSPVEYLALKQL